jgi:hypothetical protein
MDVENRVAVSVVSRVSLKSVIGVLGVEKSIETVILDTVGS